MYAGDRLMSQIRLEALEGKSTKAIFTYEGGRQR